MSRHSRAPITSPEGVRKRDSNLAPRDDDDPTSFLPILIPMLGKYHHVLVSGAGGASGVAPLAAMTTVAAGEFVVVALSAVATPDPASARRSRLELTREDERREAAALCDHVLSEKDDVLRGMWLTVDAYIPRPREGMATLRTSGPLLLEQLVGLLTAKASRDGGTAAASRQIRTDPLMTAALEQLSAARERTSARDPGSVFRAIQKHGNDWPPLWWTDEPSAEAGWTQAAIVHTSLSASGGRLRVIRDPRPARYRAPKLAADSEALLERMSLARNVLVGAVIASDGSGLDSSKSPAKRTPSKSPLRSKKSPASQRTADWEAVCIRGRGGRMFYAILLPDNPHVHPPPMAIVGEAHAASAAVAGRSLPPESSSPVRSSPARRRKVKGEAAWRAMLHIDTVSLSRGQVVSHRPAWIADVLHSADPPTVEAVLRWIEAHPFLCMRRADAEAVRSCLLPPTPPPREFVATASSSFAKEMQDSASEDEKSIEPVRPPSVTPPPKIYDHEHRPPSQTSAASPSREPTPGEITSRLVEHVRTTEEEARRVAVSALRDRKLAVDAEVARQLAEEREAKLRGTFRQRLDQAEMEREDALARLALSEARPIAPLPSSPLTSQGPKPDEAEITKFLRREAKRHKRHLLSWSSTPSTKGFLLRALFLEGMDHWHVSQQGGAPFDSTSRSISPQGHSSISPRHPPPVTPQNRRPPSLSPALIAETPTRPLSPQSFHLPSSPLTAGGAPALRPSPWQSPPVVDRALAALSPAKPERLGNAELGVDTVVESEDDRDSTDSFHPTPQKIGTFSFPAPNEHLDVRKITRKARAIAAGAVSSEADDAPSATIALCEYESPDYRPILGPKGAQILMHTLARSYILFDEAPTDQDLLLKRAFETFLNDFPARADAWIESVLPRVPPTAKLSQAQSQSIPRPKHDEEDEEDESDSQAGKSTEETTTPLELVGRHELSEVFIGNLGGELCYRVGKFGRIRVGTRDLVELARSPDPFLQEAADVLPLIHYLTYLQPEQHSKEDDEEEQDAELGRIALQSCFEIFSRETERSRRLRKLQRAATKARLVSQAKTAAKSGALVHSKTWATAALGLALSKKKRKKRHKKPKTDT